eukprot:scaffold13048_cov97-Isochrysis_galbana.AAC.3
MAAGLPRIASRNAATTSGKRAVISSSERAKIRTSVGASPDTSLDASPAAESAPPGTGCSPPAPLGIQCSWHRSPSYLISATNAGAPRPG